MTAASEKYSVLVGCKNCGKEGKLAIPQEKRIDQARCPNCRTPQLARIAWTWPWRKGFRAHA